MSSSPAKSARGSGEATAPADRPLRLAIVVTHPIQHFVPFYRALAANPAIDLHVLFGLPLGIKPYFDAQMQTEITWKMDMLAGYSSEFLEDLAPGQQSSFTAPNSGVIGARLRACAPDVILVYGYGQMNSLRALFWGRRHGVPVMMISDSEKEFRDPSLRETIKNGLIPLIYRNFAALLSVGDRNEAYYRHYGARPDRIFRSPFTIDEDAFTRALARRATSRAALRQQLGIPADAIIILYVGKLYAGKRPADLIAAMVTLKAQGKADNAHVVIAGNGEQFDELKATATNEALNVHFLGFVNVDRLPDIYAAADALAVPSEVDRHPLVCSEAACMSLPILISDRVGAIGATDIARDGENAIVYKCGDAAALAEAIDRIATSARTRARMAARSREIFDTLDMDASVQGVLDAMRAVTNSPAHGIGR